MAKFFNIVTEKKKAIIFVIYRFIWFKRNYFEFYFYTDTKIYLI